jgi:hypothetical protein
MKPTFSFEAYDNDTGTVFKEWSEEGRDAAIQSGLLVSKENHCVCTGRAFTQYVSYYLIFHNGIELLYLAFPTHR